MSKSTIPTKEQIVKDIIKINKQYKKKFPKIEGNVTRDYYKEHGKYNKEVVNKVFGSFSLAIEECKFEKKEEYTRDSIDIKKISKEINQRYFVTSIVPDQRINEKFMNSINNYCKVNNAKLVLLVMRGVNKDASFSEEVYEKYKEYFVTEMQFNSNLWAMDFRLLPQQVLSLTGLDEIDNRSSIIVASTKQFLESIPNRINEYPRLLWSTGCCTMSEYNNDRIGKIAIQHHTTGGLIVEVVDKKKFHIRNTQCDKSGGFADLGKYYNQDKVTDIKNDIILGDVHVGAECPIAIRQCKEIIKELKCDKVYFNDLFDGRSVNHHEDHDIYAKYSRLTHQQTLENELNYLGNFLQEFTKGIEDKEFIVIPSNHNDFVSRYITEGKFVFDIPCNSRLGAELFIHYLDGEDPIKYFLKSRGYIDNIDIVFPHRNDELNSYGHDIIHGDKGVSGAKGSVRSFTKCYGKNVSAHNHAPQRFKFSVRAGTNSLLDQRYISGSGSSWIHSDVLVYENGTDQIINKIEGSWRM